VSGIREIKGQSVHRWSAGGTVKGTSSFYLPDDVLDTGCSLQPMYLTIIFSIFFR
jgi:hypothetical protein